MLMLKLALLLFYTLTVYSKYSCNSVYKRKTRDVSSPIYIGSSSPTTDDVISCRFEIYAPGERIHLRWNYMEVDDVMPHCLTNYVQVSIGCDSTKRVISRYCNEYRSYQVPHDIYSNDHCMVIEFRSTIKIQDGSVLQVSSFSATYMSMDYYDTIGPSYYPCISNGVDIEEHSGLILATNLGSIFNTLNSCKWKFKFKEGWNIKLVFMNVSTNEPISYYKQITNDNKCGNADHLLITYKNTYVSTEGDREMVCITPTLKPFSVYHQGFNYVELELNFPTSINQYESGMLMGFVVFKDKANKLDEENNDKDEGTNYNLMETVTQRALYVLIPSIIVCVLGTYMKYTCVKKRRREQQQQQQRGMELVDPANNNNTVNTTNAVTNNNIIVNTNTLPMTPYPQQPINPPLPPIQHPLPPPLPLQHAPPPPPTLQHPLYVPPSYHDVLTDDAKKQRTVHLPNHRISDASSYHPLPPQPPPPVIPESLKYYNPLNSMQGDNNGNQTSHPPAVNNNNQVSPYPKQKY